MTLAALAAMLWSLPAAAQEEYRQPALENPESWSVVVIPDLQGYAKNEASQPIARLMTAWIADNIERLNVRMVLCVGDVVEQNQVLLIIEAMKMETSVVARMAGRVDKLHRCKGRRTAHRDQVEQRYCCHKYSKNRRMRASACFLFLCAGNVEKCGALFWSK